jgi:superfamily I DNA/RNA helicase
LLLIVETTIRTNSKKNRAAPVKETVQNFSMFADSILNDTDCAESIKKYAQKYRSHPFGRAFRRWFNSWENEPYYSFGNGSAINTDRVTISTIHSVKGLDFSCVFLIGFDFLKPKGWAEEQTNNPVYGGLLRARYRRYFPYIRNCPIIEKLQLCIGPGF